MPIRHRDVSRLEGFSDAVFGFALTLLVVNLETPNDVAGLQDLVRGLIPFGLMFAMVCWIWYEHNVFFRNYDLQDPYTAFLNSVLLFVVLFYVYPLKFLTTALSTAFLDPAIVAANPAKYPNVRDMDGQYVMYLYSGGVLAIFGIFVLLHLHARRKRHELALSEGELLKLRYSMRSHMISAALAVVSLVLAFLLPRHSWVAGVLYSLMGPLHALNGYAGGKAQSRFAEAEGTPPPPGGQ